MCEDSEIVLVGGGIMSFTLAAMLKELKPSAEISLYEMLEDVGLESSMVWNNAGTGHQALCELNYTPKKSDGSIDTTKAFAINQQYELSKEFWAHCVKKNILQTPSSFLNPVPHLSFVVDNIVPYLKLRYETLSKSPLFRNMQYSQDHDQIKQWAPLLLEGRDPNQQIAATYMAEGTDVDFGAIVHQLRDSLSRQKGFNIYVNHKVTNLTKEGNTWLLDVKDKTNGTAKQVKAKFVFLGAGGGSFPLLQKSGIPESKGYGGFPVGGLWLVCKNRDIIDKHQAKIYGKASIGDPPMSVPHLDTRIIDGKKELLFGPYAGFNTKFLKRGSLLDFPLSIRANNSMPMIQAGIDNVPLTIYLIKQILLTNGRRMRKLNVFIPSAKLDDWKAKFAGQRVQIIKKDAQGRGSLQFGTEVITSSDGSLAALLGASPGASTTVNIMVQVLKRCFKDEMDSQEWQDKIREMLPSYGRSLEENIAHFNECRAQTASILNLPFKEI
ncbi:malate dehydrogenase (quinone) [Helicobacter sp. MIT 05-5293]|uniref:malate dehydrogenase (quinone) n=1 Tax=Helicobacter sp. MIT 05-5293 TaxID=1548149 RepID=UPI00051DC605|nr:malate dehydrogenase (quinone) [Helicobacter sp. MIT 05-5293]TLD82210.1 malate dehydrogenase (quinone) [Helicobacter sp. MIT 05-5293]